MKKLTIAFFALALGTALFAQQKPAVPTVDLSRLYSDELKAHMAAVRDAAMNSDYAWQQLAYLTENIGPRITGSPQADAAAEYVAAEMRRIGLDAHLEKVMVPHWVRGAETAELVQWSHQPSGVRQKIVVTALGGSTSTPADGITTNVVVVRDYDELKALGREKVAGNIVLFNVKFDTRKSQAGRWSDAYSEAVQYRGDGAEAAAALGAVASLVRSVGSATFRLPHTGWSKPAGIPAGAVASEDADLIADLAAQGNLRMHLTLTPQLLPEAPGYNVVADLRGSEHPEQVVVVSGHLDSWDLGTGAIDDGAGVVMAMQTANLFCSLKIQPKRTIRVIAWMNEESGLRGGTGYAEAHQAELINHIAGIESDSGAGHPLGFNAKITAASADWLKPVQHALEPLGADLINVVAHEVGADISPMSKAGVPSFGLSQDARTYFDYHHTAADTLDKVDPRQLQENSAAMAVLALALADMTEPLPR